MGAWGGSYPERKPVRVTWQVALAILVVVSLFGALTIWLLKFFS